MTTPSERRGHLGAFDIGCVVVGGIVGVGIFFTPQRVARAVDTPAQVIAAWTVGGVIALLGALVFAGLSRRVPGHGGTFTYIHAAFGALPAFLYGWANWLVIQSGALAVIGLVMVDHAERVILGEPGPQGPALSMLARLSITAATILVFTALNIVGLRVGRATQNLLTVLKMGAVFALVLLGLLGAKAPAAGEIVPGAGEARLGLAAALQTALLPVLFAFGGWQQGSFVAGAARRRSDVAVGIVAGVVVVVVAYLTVNLAFLDLLGFDGARSSRAIGADAARAALAPWGIGEHAARILAAMVVVSALGIMNTICLAPPYVLYTMAQRGVFLPAAGRLHARFRTPAVGVAVQGGWAIVLLFASYAAQELARPARPDAPPPDVLGFLLDGVVFVDWLFFALCGAAYVALAGNRSLLVALPFTAAAIAVTVGAVSTAPAASGVGLALCCLGLLVYALSRGAWARARLEVPGSSTGTDGLTGADGRR